ncbi:Palmitoyltransferase ZDHHC17 [Tetrabaena socialis]|uniref:Palmitoyltransferase ZDHHC17 n=1 Tax=Tetrabaena socialis TaxID=47790 RepID=A0A2J8A522_9CHLO|nr:Palmitoyltransferase ZDHHC17 [Tetrabaena socialis]|eukprot:PNH07618.1 Palmitoyltransferase ZDHHC17 [Tetrabaena socialis]
MHALGTRHGNTALHWASEKGHPKVVEMLLRAGADKEAENNEGETPLDLALLWTSDHPCAWFEGSRLEYYNFLLESAAKQGDAPTDEMGKLKNADDYEQVVALLEGWGRS